MDKIAFDAQIIEWRGPPPYLFAVVPDEHIAAIRYAALTESYGWGVVPVVVRVGATDFTTSLFPRDGGYLVPVKVAVQRAEGIGRGDRIKVLMRVGRPQS
ncbi:hypothetical protein ATE67_15480 [Sphingopyxis sp. H050]|jgi:hypothetical protein|uniref:DUF1905 domain-containing protein n=1 Tax=Sphingopyxis sp. H050 TaxID=1759072 RepID=UPI000736FDA3|nr:DUF1905 domain-containing protein [Sphingopyxis sp. H050]KTE19383.1 hypothetical protein ATE67_15480 [Sphingopyxis sp. H050]